MALVQSASLAELERHSKLVAYVIDENTADLIVVGIGEGMGTHFTRFRTLEIGEGIAKSNGWGKFIN